MGRFDDLSPYDFELLVSDLLSRELDCRFETFPSGADGGIDLRARFGSGYHYVQCKHYQRSTFGQLNAAARREFLRMTERGLRPRRYTFVTSRELTARNKSTLAGALGDLVDDASDIVGAADLEALLRKHPQVERAHVKLWLRSTAQLQRIVNAEVLARSEALLDDIRASLPRYVQTDGFAVAHTLLHEHRVVIVAGPPGVGKTTLARLLLLDAAEAGFVPYSIQSDIAEAWRLFSPDEPQAFFFDDFLGRTALFDSVGDDVRDLGNFVRRVRRSPSTQLILSTREYVLQQAGQRVEDLRWQRLDASKYALTLNAYTRFERAHIFYNHLYFSPALTDAVRHALVRDRSYAEIIDHEAYSPRLIEWMTGFGGRALTATDLASFSDFCLSVLDNPDGLWTYAHDQGLDAPARCLLLQLLGLPAAVEIGTLELAYRAAARQRRLPTSRSAFDAALKVLEGSFVRIRHMGGSDIVSALNPSLIDFLRRRLLDDPDELLSSLEGAVYFRQVTYLTRLALEADDNLEALADAIATAARRTISVPGPPAAGSDSAIDRLGSVAEWCSHDPLRKALTPLIDEAVSVLVSWVEEADGNDIATLPPVVAQLEAAGIDGRALVAATKLQALALRDDLSAYDTLGELHRSCQHAFSAPEWAEVTTRFRDWAADRLSESINWFRDPADLARLEDAAELLAVALPRALLTEAWADMNAMMNEREYDALGDVDPFDEDYGYELNKHDRADELLDTLDYEDLREIVLNRNRAPFSEGAHSVLSVRASRSGRSPGTTDVDILFRTLGG
jgi:DNA polymerase III delta prime subunit